MREGSTIEFVLFCCFAAMILAGAFGVLLSRNIVRTAMWLLSTLAAAAGLYFLLGATFVAAIQLTIYAGGTLVLIVFGVMLTAQDPKVRLGGRRAELVGGAVVCVALAGLLVAVYLRTDWKMAPPAPDEHAANPAAQRAAPASQADEAGRINSAADRLTDLDAPGHDGTANLGRLFLGDYLVPFEVVSLLLLAVLIGAAYLARPRGEASGSSSAEHERGESGAGRSGPGGGA